MTAAAAATGPPTLVSRGRTGTLLTVEELAGRLGQGAWFLQRRLDNGELPPPDGHNAAGGPVWREETIRAWQASDQG